MSNEFPHSTLDFIQNHICGSPRVLISALCHDAPASSRAETVVLTTSINLSPRRGEAPSNCAQRCNCFSQLHCKASLNRRWLRKPVSSVTEACEATKGGQEFLHAAKWVGRGRERETERVETRQREGLVRPGRRTKRKAVSLRWLFQPLKILLTKEAGRQSEREREREGGGPWWETGSVRRVHFCETFERIYFKTYPVPLR